MKAIQLGISAVVVLSFLGCDETASTNLLQQSANQATNCQKDLTKYGECVEGCLSLEDSSTLSTCLDDCLALAECTIDPDDIAQIPSSTVTVSLACEVLVIKNNDTKLSASCNGDENGIVCECSQDAEGISTSISCNQDTLSCPGCCAENLGLDDGFGIDVDIPQIDVPQIDIPDVDVSDIDNLFCSTLSSSDGVSLHSHCVQEGDDVLCSCVSVAEDGSVTESTCSQESVSCPGCCESL